MTTLNAVKLSRNHIEYCFFETAVFSVQRTTKVSTKFERAETGSRIWGREKLTPKSNLTSSTACHWVPLICGLTKETGCAVLLHADTSYLMPVSP